MESKYTVADARLVSSTPPPPRLPPLPPLQLPPLQLSSTPGQCHPSLFQPCTCLHGRESCDFERTWHGLERVWCPIRKTITIDLVSAVCFACCSRRWRSLAPSAMQWRKSSALAAPIWCSKPTAQTEGLPVDHCFECRSFMAACKAAEAAAGKRLCVQYLHVCVMYRTVTRLEERCELRAWRPGQQHRADGEARVVYTRRDKRRTRSTTPLPRGRAAADLHTRLSPLFFLIPAPSTPTVHVFHQFSTHQLQTSDRSPQKTPLPAGTASLACCPASPVARC